MTHAADVSGPARSTVHWQEAGRRLGAATLHEAAGRTGALPAVVARVSGPALAGPAFPVRCPSGDNLWLHRAVYAARPGDVLVADVGPGVEYGYWGEILAEAAMAQQIAGLVTTGMVRDATAMRRLEFPVYASGLCIRGTVKDPAGDGSIGAVVTVGGIVVAPGDLVVGDDDGVVVIAAQRVDEVIAAGDARVRAETETIERIRRGATTIDLYGLDRGR